MRQTHHNTSDNDNEPLTFITLGLAAERVILQLQKKPREERTDSREPEDAEQEKDETFRAFVDHRLRDLAAFERRAAGKKNGARRQ